MTREKKVKRVKTQNDVSSPQPNLNVDFFQVEEQEARDRDSKEDESLFKETCAEIQKNIKRIHELKKRGKAQAEVDDLRVRTAFLFLQLKKINRLDKHRLKAARDAVCEKKQKVDNFHLQLQNLTYEVMHLQKEVTKCMEFRSKDEEIDLVPVEQFCKETGQSVEDTHQLTLARLNWELQQRKQLSKKLEELESCRQGFYKEIEKKKQCIYNLQPTLLSILESTRPLHQELGLPLQAQAVEHSQAHALPRPLYVLYVQCHAYRHAHGDIFEVAVEGSIEEALPGLLEDKRDEDSPGESDQEEPAPAKRHHRRSTRGASGRAKLLMKHPLGARLTFQCRGHTLQLVFWYAVQLHIVTVELHLQSPTNSASPVLCATSLLDNLLDEVDTGSSSPNPANHFQLQKHGVSRGFEELGKAYMWAQRLAGLDFLGGQRQKENVQMNCTFVEQALEAIRTRFSARVALHEQILALEQGTVPVPSSLASNFPVKVVSTLKQWVQSTDEEVAQSHPGYKEVEELGILEEGHFAFTALIQRGSAQMRAHVLVAGTYPKVPPLFLLALHWREKRTSRDDDALKELEREVNLEWGNTDSVLSIQMQQLLVGLDVLLEASADCSLHCPREFAHDKVLAHPVRGRSRSHPYKFLSHLGLFTHRL
uniref:Putative monocyte differentiation n=2 Tax=Ornithodoros turicata TaxID=34597 RepID=A0A2R5LLC7_9ACAR